MLNFEWITFLAVIFNFGIVYWLFMKFFYKPIKTVIDQNENAAKLAEAKKIEIFELEKTSGEKCQKNIADSEEQARGIISGANELSDEIVNKAKEDARAQAKNLILAAEDEIKASMEASNRHLKKQALKMAQSISNGVVSSVISERMDQDFIMNVIQNIDQTKILDKTNRSLTFRQAIEETSRNNSSIVVYSTRELPWEIKEELHKQISRIRKTAQIIEFQTSNRLSGGIIIDFGFNELDFSLNAQIHSIIEQLS